MDYATISRERRKFQKFVLDNRRNSQGFSATVNSNYNDDTLPSDYENSLTLFRKWKRISKSINLTVGDRGAQHESIDSSSQTTIHRVQDIEQSYLGMEEYEC